jgi:hypothetical protein
VAQCSSSSSVVLARSWFDLSEKLHLVGGGFADRLPRHRGPSARYKLPSDRPRVGYRQSVFRRCILVVQVAFADRPP